MELILFENAKRAIAQLQEFDEVREHLDKAAAVQEYARRAKDRDMEVRAAEYRVYCERRAGEMLQGTPEGRPKNSPKEGVLTSKQAKIPSQEASRFRQLAEVPTDAFTEAVEELKSEGKPPTRKRVMDVHYSSNSAEHYTPDKVIELVFQVMKDIDLDPCADLGKNVPAQAHYTQQDDGLAREWFGRVYMNPPYGREIETWVDKLTEEYTSRRVTEAIALVPSRTDTKWFNKLAAYPVCFVEGRLKFKGNRDYAPFPSAVFYLGNKRKTFAKQFSELGAIWECLTR